MKDRKKILHGKEGFTLIELIVVIAVIAILASVMLPRFTGFTEKARETAIKSDIRNYATGVNALITEGATLGAGNEKKVTDYIGNLGGDFKLDTITSSGNPYGGDFTYTKTFDGGNSLSGSYDYDSNTISVP